MPAQITEKAADLLEDMPPYEADDPWVQAIVDVYAREYARIEERLEEIVLAAFPQNSTDEFRMLGLHEQQAGLAVEPGGITEALRREKVLAVLRSRDVSSGLRWSASLSQALGSSDWTHEEHVPAANQITLHLPGVGSTYAARQFERFARAVTPAHLELLFDWSGGFVVGESLIGDNL